jgi:dolichyl-phosphate beta-glucosyltransferase
MEALNPHSSSGTVAGTPIPEVSLVIPVFNGAAFIARNLEETREFLSSRIARFEIVVIDDGSTDGTADLVEGLTDDRLSLLRIPSNKGKFAAIKAGMSAASGLCRIFTDADLPYDLEAVPHIRALVNDRRFHLVVGDRTLAESETLAPSGSVRSLTTKAFSFFVRMLVTGELFDTQCGLKGFRADVAEALFPLLTDDGFSGDVELLYVALKYNLEIRRIPVRLQRSAPTTVSLAAHSLPMLGCIAGLRRNWTSGCYHSERLRSLASQAYWLRTDTGGSRA